MFDYETLSMCLLFENFQKQEIKNALCCIRPLIKKYQQDEIIADENNTLSYIAIVISGSVQIEKVDYNGNQLIMTQIFKTEIFNESFICSEKKEFPYTIRAKENSEILLIDYQRIIASCSNACSHHLKLINNMIKILANKNIYLNQRIDILSKRSIKDKVLCYLSYQNKDQNKKIKIPFSRQELADYLCVDRSALSRELSNMQEQGIIDYSYETFEVFSWN